VGTGPLNVRVGRVGRAHGLDGAFVVEHASADERWWRVGSHLLAAGAEVEVVLRRTSSGRPVVKLDKPVGRGTWLEVERERLPPTGADEFYVFELVGLEVVEENGGRLGNVAEVIPGVANDVLELDGGLLLPLVADCVVSIDLEARRIVIAEGFVA
jgi:16S rRNA processing protein RimM